MKTEKVEIKTIKLNLGGKEVELTVEQAKKLKGALDELFGKEIVRELVHHDYYHGWYWTIPTVIYPQYPTTPTITWDVTNHVSMSGNTLCLNA